MKTPYDIKADSRRKTGSSLYLWIISIILAIYSYQSFVNSSFTGNPEASRVSVYVLLVVLMILMAIPVFLGPPLPRGSLVSRCLWALFAWVLLIDILSSTESWTIAVRVGLSFWWPITYIFMARLALRNQRARQLLPPIMVIFFVFFAFMTLFSVLRLQQFTGSEQSVSGQAYFVLSASPFIFLLEQSWTIRFALITLGVFAIGFSNKRGALLATAGIFFATAFIYLRSGLLSPRKLIAFLGIPLIFALLLWYLNRASDGFLLSRFGREQLSDGSGRREIWTAVLADIQQGSFERKLIGGGSDSTLKLLGTGTHNEWLEFQNCYGVVGVLLLAVLLVAIAATAHRYFRAGHSDRASAVIAVFALSLAQTLYSGFYFVHSTFFSMAVLGFARGLELLDSAKTGANPGQRDVSPHIGPLRHRGGTTMVAS